MTDSLSKNTIPPSIEKILRASSEISDFPDKKELCFVARSFINATLPHKDPGEIPLWSRSSNNVTLSIKPDWKIDKQTGESKCVGVPYGTIPRLILFWITTEAVRKKSRRIELGHNLSSFMKELGLSPTGGRWGTINRLKEQMMRLFRAKISFDYHLSSKDHQEHLWMDMQVSTKGEFWWSYHQPDQSTVWTSWIELDENFYEAICSSPVPIDMRILRAIKNSPLALDLYTWISYRSFFSTQNRTLYFISWESLSKQLGTDYSDMKDFKKNIKNTSKKILSLSPNVRVSFCAKGDCQLKIFIQKYVEKMSYPRINTPLVCA
jgi:hypothetical protein